MFKLTISELQQFLYSQQLNNAIDFNRDDSLDMPMTDYFIYSSHNTYLKQGQIFGIKILK